MNVFCKQTSNMADYSSEFNPLDFIRKPDVILRLIGWVFSVVVFGCISSQGWVDNVCVYKHNHGACGFGTFVGVMAFLGLMTFLVLAAVFDNLSNIEHKKIIVLTEAGFSGVFAFFFFVSFCYLTNQWSNTTDSYPRSGPEAAIAFTFFSIFIFIGLTFLAIRKFQHGLGDPYRSYYDQDYYDSTPAPYGGSNLYQDGGPMVPPFTATEERPLPGQQQPQQSY